MTIVTSLYFTDSIFIRQHLAVLVQKNHNKPIKPKNPIKPKTLLGWAFKNDS